MKNALDFYDSKLLEQKPCLIIGHKIDKLMNVEEKLAELGDEIKLPIIPMSAEKKINLKKFLKILKDVYEKSKINSIDS